jgi:hypothetical protein
MRVIGVLGGAAFITLLTASSPAFASGGELKLGRYVGYVKLDDTGEKVALVANTFIVQPEDFTEFPKLNAIFTMFLGGYGAPEYVTETFEDIRYDFNNGQLSLDEEANDLVVTGEVNESPGTFISGQVWLRSAARSGTLCLAYETDEPGEENACQDEMGDRPSAPEFVPALRGRYEGQCGSEHAAIQITTGKGLSSEETGAPADRRGLHGYGLVAQLAFDDPTVCGAASPPQPAWCVSRTFTAGAYNFFSGRLMLDDARGTTSCNLAAGRLRCRLQLMTDPVDCDLQKTDVAAAPYRSFSRSFTVRTTAEQRAELPPPSPPRHTELVSALRGQFYGYVHNELTDRYQPMRLNVIPTVSTVNPHNENELFVSTTVVTYFGRTLSPEFWPQPLAKRSFYLRPGFTLESPEVDGFLQIEDWRTGYVRGVWYSHAFGRVGSVQLVKGDALPPLDVDARIVPSIDGAFQGPPRGELSWSFATAIPTQPTGREQSTFVFEGSARLSGGLVRPIRMARGTYDVYTGALSWLSGEETPRMVMGRVDDEGTMALLWPGASIWGARLSGYEFAPFLQVTGPDIRVRCPVCGTGSRTP